jgi:hypothetical protein
MARRRIQGAAAIEMLSSALRYELGVPEPDSHINGTLYPVYVRGEAFLKAGRAREAAAEFQKLIDHRGVVLNFILGALAHLQLRRAKAQSGDLKAHAKPTTGFSPSGRTLIPTFPSSSPH